MKLIVGLGNPGSQYARTRHNVGFDVVDELAKSYNITLNRLKFNAIIGEGRIENEKVILMKPTTYMNNSGIAVKQAYNYYKLEPKDLLIIQDDIDIAFGSLRLRKNGSAGTHNGLKSIIFHLVRDDFPRAKIGIGQRPSEYDLADFVLSKFSEQERKIIDETIVKAAKACACYVTSDLENAMNRFNTKPKKEKAKKQIEKADKENNEAKELE